MIRKFQAYANYKKESCVLGRNIKIYLITGFFCIGGKNIDQDFSFWKEQRLWQNHPY